MKCIVQWLGGSEARKLEHRPRELGNIGEVVTCLVAHPRNDLVVIGTNTGKLVLWDPAQRMVVSSLQAHKQEVTRVRFVGAGQSFVTSSTDGTLFSWDSSFNLLKQMNVGSAVYDIAVAADGERVAAVGSEKLVTIFSLDSGTQLDSLAGHTDEATACAWLSKTTLVTGGAEGNLLVWDVKDRRVTKRFKPHNARICQLKVGHGGTWYLTASWDKQVKQWNMSHRERYAITGGPDAVTNAEVSEDDHFIMVCYWNGLVGVWDNITGKRIDEFQAHKSMLVGGALLAGSQYLITSDQDSSLRLWNLQDMGVARYINQHSGEAYALTYTPDNLHLLSAGHDGRILVWSRETRDQTDALEGQAGPMPACAVSPDNRNLVTGHPDGSIRVWHAQDRVFESSWAAHADLVSSLSFVTGGTHLVSTSWDMKAKLWSMETQQAVISFDGHSKEVSACDTTLDARRLVTASWDGTARVWDLVSHRRGIGKELMTLAGHNERVLCCAFSPNGQAVATGAGDRSVRLWHAEERGAAPKILLGHIDAVTACRFTPDGQVLLSTDRSGHIMVWNATSGDIVDSIDHSVAILSLAISPDGQEAAVGDESGQVRFLQLGYEAGPPWVAASAILRERSLLTLGAPPKETFHVLCRYCGVEGPVKKSDLGSAWQCPACSAWMMICPRSLPAVAEKK